MSELTLFPLQYQRQDAVPVDIDSTFATTALRMAYLTSPRRYPGMVVTDLQQQTTYILSTDRSSWLSTVASFINSTTDLPEGTNLYYTDARVESVGDTRYQLVSQKGIANGYVPLNSSALIDSAYLPSYVDDVLEFSTRTAFPSTGETGKIYIADDTNAQYRWSGSTYIQLVASPGSTDAVPEGTTNLYYTNARVQAFGDGRYELLSNKQNSLVADSTNTKYPTVTAINAALSGYAKLLGGNTFTSVQIVNDGSVTLNNTLGGTLFTEIVIGSGTVGSGSTQTTGGVMKFYSGLSTGTGTRYLLTLQQNYSVASNIALQFPLVQGSGVLATTDMFSPYALLGSANIFTGANTFNGGVLINSTSYFQFEAPNNQTAVSIGYGADSTSGNQYLGKINFFNYLQASPFTGYQQTLQANPSATGSINSLPLTSGILLNSSDGANFLKISGSGNQVATLLTYFNNASGILVQTPANTAHTAYMSNQIQYTNTSSVSYVYSFPSISGTLALTSQLTGGTVTNITSADGLATFANSSTTPSMTLNVGNGASQIVVRNGIGETPIGKNGLVYGSTTGSVLSDDPYVGASIQVTDSLFAASKGIKYQLGAGGDLLLMTFTGTNGTGTWTIAGRISNTGSNLTMIGAVNATAFNVTSARDKKDNIQLYTENALQKINELKISSFTYKSDLEQHFKVGIIADDTDPLFSTKNKNTMDIATTLGVSLKAIQELSQEIETLKKELSKYK